MICKQFDILYQTILESINQRIFLFTFHGQDIEVIKNASRREQLSLANSNDDISGSFTVRQTQRVNVGVTIYPDLNSTFSFNRRTITHADVHRLLNFKQKNHIDGYYYNYGDKTLNEFIITSFNTELEHEDVIDLIQKHLNVNSDKIYMNVEG